MQNELVMFGNVVLKLISLDASSSKTGEFLLTRKSNYKDNI